jgi:hypothetical protein
MSMWQPRRPSPTFSTLGEKVGGLIMAPTKEDAERLAITLHGRPVLVELVVQHRLTLRSELDL